MEQIYIPKQDYKVLVRCFTYNQSKYIEDALKGFAMQQTEIPFVCLVMDDCSTDGEQEVIKAWMERECDMVKAEYIDIELSNVIIVPHKSNTSCTFAFYFLKQNLYGSGKKKMNMVYPWRECCEYEALCEVDDYWIAEDKLQKQVEIMEYDKSVSMVYSKAKLFYQNQAKFDGSMGKPTSFEQLLCAFNNAIPTASILRRIDVFNAYIKEVDLESKSWKMGDYPFNLYASLNHRIHFIDNVTTVYRILSNSASHNSDETKLLPYYKSIFDVKKFFLELSGSEKLKGKMCQHYLGFAYKMYCRIKCKEVKELINVVYTYMNKDYGYENLIYKFMLSSHIHWTLKKIISGIYSKV